MGLFIQHHPLLSNILQSSGQAYCSSCRMAHQLNAHACIHHQLGMPSWQLILGWFLSRVHLNIYKNYWLILIYKIITFIVCESEIGGERLDGKKQREVCFIMAIWVYLTSFTAGWPKYHFNGWIGIVIYLRSQKKEGVKKITLSFCDGSLTWGP